MLDAGFGALPELAGLTPERFVSGLYTELLRRMPQQQELANWVAALNSGVSCGKVALSLLSSEEYRDHLVNAYSQLGSKLDVVDLASRTQKLQVDALREALNRGWANSAEETSRLVSTTYDSFLNRAPDASWWLASRDQQNSLPDLSTSISNLPVYVDDASSLINLGEPLGQPVSVAGESNLLDQIPSPEQSQEPLPPEIAPFFSGEQAVEVATAEDQVLPSFAFDFGTRRTAVAPGYVGVPLLAYREARGYGWRSLSGLRAADRATGDALTSDFHRGARGTFLVDLPNGTYDVTVTLGDAKARHANMAIWLNGQQVASGLTTKAGQFLQQTHRVEITDGQLRVRLASTGRTSRSFAINALNIVPVPSNPVNLFVDAGPDLVTDLGNSVYFEGKLPPEAEAVSILWDFGDGATAEGSLTIEYYYAEPGNYTATLMVLDASGMTVEDTVSVTIMEQPVEDVLPPNDETPMDETPVDEVPPDVPPISETDPPLGDPVPPVDPLPPPVNETPPTGAETPPPVGDTPPPVMDVGPPQAEAGVDLSADEGAVVQFTGSVTGGSGALSYLWDFGDGAVESGSLTPVHVYADNGTYVATLTITDSLGGTSQDSTTVRINNAAPLVTSGGPYVRTPGSPVNFFATAADSAADTAAGFTYQWTFGDGSTGSGRTPSHTYATPGNYSVTLTVTDKDGASQTVSTTATISATQVVSSPTGRNPAALWSPEQQAVWNRMVAENHPYWQLIQARALTVGTSNGWSPDWAVLAYQMTGDASFAEKAFSTLPIGASGPDLRASDSNGFRQNATAWVIMYDWLRPWLDQDIANRRQPFMNWLNDVADYTLSQVENTRLEDSDETVGGYFFHALVGVVTADHNPRAAEILNHPHVGGLQATGDWGTERNVIRYYVETLGAGGEWIESTEYNNNTVHLLLMGYRAVRDAAGYDPFPEITAWIKSAALAMVHQLTPDLTGEYQWGDLQHTHYIHIQWRAVSMAMLATLTASDPDVGPYVQEALLRLLQTYQHTPASPRFFYLFDPYAPTKELTSLGQGHYAPGRGLVYFHDGWQPSDSFLGLHLPGRNVVDHIVRHFGDFQLYRQGEWVLTHPLGYAYTDAETANSMLIAGLSGAEEIRGPVAQEFGPSGSYVYYAGTTEGYYREWPPEFLHEWTRSFFYLPSADNHSDTLIIFDRVNAEDPRTLHTYDYGYNAQDKQRIESAPSLKQWFMHAPVAPTVGQDGSLSWTTAGGQQVKLSTLSAMPTTTTISDESQLGLETYFSSHELQYQIRIAPTVDRQWDTFLNVVQAYDAGTSLQNTAVRSAGGEAEGVLVQRAGASDALVMFGAKQDSRVLTSGYTATWTGGTGAADLYLLDLDPSKQWRVRIDGGQVINLAVSGQGVGRLSINAAPGSHTFELIAV